MKNILIIVTVLAFLYGFCVVAYAFTINVPNAGLPAAFAHGFAFNPLEIMNKPVSSLFLSACLFTLAVYGKRRQNRDAT